MYCSSCFQAAEEGSTLCADCRQRNTEPGGGESSLAAVAPPATTVPLLEGGESVDQGCLGNPFGEVSIPGGWQIPSDPPTVVETGQEVPQEVPPETDAEWLAEIVTIHPSRWPGRKVIQVMLLAGLLVLSLAILAQALRPPRSEVTIPVTATTALPMPDDVASAPLTLPDHGDASETSNSVRAEFTAVELSLKAKDFESAGERSKGLLADLQASDAPVADIRRAELLLAASHLGMGRSVEAHQLAQKLAVGTHPEAKMAGQLLAVAEQQMQIKAHELFTEGVEELRAGRVEQATEKAQAAQRILDEYGGTSEQKEQVAAFLEHAGRLGGGQPFSSSEPNGSKAQATSRRPRAVIDSGPSHPTRPPESSSHRSSERADETNSSVSPLSRHVRTGSTPPEERPPEQSQPESSPETQEPNQTNQETPGEPSYEDRDRAGSQDELPTYRSRTGGSAY